MCVCVCVCVYFTQEFSVLHIISIIKIALHGGEPRVLQN